MKAQVNHISDQLAIWSSRAFRVAGLWIIVLAVIAVCNHKFDELRSGVEAMPAGLCHSPRKNSMQGVERCKPKAERNSKQRINRA